MPTVGFSAPRGGGCPPAPRARCHALGWCRAPRCPASAAPLARGGCPPPPFGSAVPPPVLGVPRRVAPRVPPPPSARAGLGGGLPPATHAGCIAGMLGAASPMRRVPYEHDAVPKSYTISPHRKYRTLSFCNFFAVFLCQFVNCPYICSTSSAHARHVVGMLTPRDVLINMAILLNIISTGSRKSAGAATFRKVRGRTIMSQKRGSSAKSLETRAAVGLVRTYREAIFFIMSAFADGMQNSINQSFEPTEYGSRRNAFFKLNYSAVELAVNRSELGLALLDQIMHNVSFTGVSISRESGAVTFTSFDEAGWNTLMREAYAAGVIGAYTRSTIGAKVINTFDAVWNPTADPGTAVVTGMVVRVATGTTGQTITAVEISGTNLPETPTYSIRPGSPTIAALVGSWNGHVFTPSGASATYEWRGTYTIYITDGTRVLYSRDVTFYSPGAGGE